jgi:hypothetical protein
MSAKTIGMSAKTNTKGAAHVMNGKDHLFNNGGAVYRRGAGSATAAGQYSSTSRPRLSFPVSSLWLGS